MAMNFPDRIRGGNRAASWLNRLLEAASACRIKSVVGGQLIQSTDGVSLVFDSFARGSAGRSASTLRVYRLKAVREDYLVCRTWDPWLLEEGTENVFIAKMPKLRHSILSETIEGREFFYDYPDDEFPWDTDLDPLGGFTGLNDDGTTDGDPQYLSRYRFAYTDAEREDLFERQVVVPEWLEDDEIYAEECSVTGVTRTTNVGEEDEAEVRVTLLMRDDGRAWARHA